MRTIADRKNAGWETVRKEREKRDATIAAQAARIEALTQVLRNIVNGDYNNAREIHAAERYAREELALLAAVPVVGAGTRAVAGEKGG